MIKLKELLAIVLLLLCMHTFAQPKREFRDTMCKWAISGNGNPADAVDFNPTT